MKFDFKILNLLDRRNFASFATVNSDCSPQVTSVWIDYDSDHNILINTAKGRVKERNILKNTKVAVSIYDLVNPYETVAIRGIIIDNSTKNAIDHFNKLAKKYLNLDEYPLKNQNEVRTILKIKPTKVSYTCYPLKEYFHE